VQTWRRQGRVLFNFYFFKILKSYDFRHAQELLNMLKSFAFGHAKNLKGFFTYSWTFFFSFYLIALTLFSKYPMP